MSSQVYDINLVQGNNLYIILTATDSAGTALDLTSYSVRGQVREKYSSSNVLLDLNPSILNATGGMVLINVSGYQTSNVPCGQFPFDLECCLSGVTGNATLGEQYVTKFLKGYCNVSVEVTR